MKTGDFDPAILEDRYRTALVEVLRAEKGEMPVADGPVQPSAQNVINLMDALRRSMESQRSEVANPPPRRAASKPAGARRVHAVEAPADISRRALKRTTAASGWQTGDFWPSYGSMVAGELLEYGGAVPRSVPGILLRSPSWLRAAPRAR